MRNRSLTRAATLAALGMLVAAPAALAAKKPPPPPKSTSGRAVKTVVASGLNTPTSFAFGRGAVFEGDGGAETNGPPNGGVFHLAKGHGTKLAGSPQFVAGLTWHAGALYVSGGTVSSHGVSWQLQRWSGWNGKRFAKRKVLYTAPQGFDGFNGIAFGPDGRLYVGVDVGLTDKNDHGPASTSPYVYDILSFTATGQDMQVFATGMRQPWQFAFAPGSPYPFVSDLGQDKGAKNPPDFLLQVHPGDNYGFPACNGTTANPCTGYASPFKTFGPHTDIMGLAIIGHRLYMTSFAGTKGKGPGGEVLSMPLSGGKLTPVLTGFAAPTVGLSAHGHTLFVGELSGQVFSVKLK
jgi:glucose/arabinose dehydrogenase